MKQYLAVLLVVALLGFGAPAIASPITYTLTGYADGANTLNGSITVDDSGTIGEVTQSEVTAWSFSAVGSPTFSINSGQAGASFSCNSGGGGFCFSVTGNNLDFDFTSADPFNPLAEFHAPLVGGFGVSFVDEGVFLPAGGVVWSSTPVADEPERVVVLSPGRVVGTAAGGSIPEPGTLLLVAIAVAVGLGVSGVRARRREAAAV